MKRQDQRLWSRARWGRGVLLALLFATDAHALEIDVHIGPPGLGTGGSNPVSIPPVSPVDYEFEFVTQNDWETAISICPGLLFGHRTRSPTGLYVGTGGGLVIDANGSGPGIYGSLGYSAGKGLRFNAELKQAAGLAAGKSRIISPYALRLGVAFDL